MEFRDVYKHIDEYCKIFKFHPESLIGYHINNNGLPHKEIPRHFVFEYPTEDTYKYIPNGYKFIREYNYNHGKKRKDFD